MKIEDRAKEFPLHKPPCEYGRSDIYVVFTDDGQMDLAVYDSEKNLWYSQTDPTGFNNVKWYVTFDIPEKFEYGTELLDLIYGESL